MNRGGQKAVECGRELMKPEYGYRLMDNYKDIFTLENEGNAETIWACVCSPSVNQQMAGSCYFQRVPD